MKERTEILEETFRKLVEEKKFSSLRDLMATMYPADVASILSDLPKDMLPALFGCCPRTWRRTPSWRWTATSRKRL